MLASPPVSLIASNFGSVHPGDDAVPKTRMIIASGASCGRLNITLSTVLIGSSVAGGTGGGAAGGAGGTGPGSAGVAGGGGGLVVCFFGFFFFIQKTQWLGAGEHNAAERT